MSKNTKRGSQLAGELNPITYGGGGGGGGGVFKTPPNGNKDCSYTHANTYWKLFDFLKTSKNKKIWRNLNFIFVSLSLLEGGIKQMISLKIGLRA